MTINNLREKDLIILECISGSKAYGLDTPTSDTDIKGIFLSPKRDFYGLNYIEQISNETNDIVFYELGRFMELLSVNNPNILELLDTLNPIDKKRKSPLDFCYVNYQNGSIPVTKFLKLKKWIQKKCGLANISHMKDVFGLYYDESMNYEGIIKSENSNDISLSSIPKGEEQIALLYFNRNGYSTYCKDYREYWNWVNERNDERYKNTRSHGKNYDSKNMMHTFRLLNMAIEIAEQKKINVRRNDREFLLKIKSGEFEYDELLNMAKEKQIKMEIAFENSDLPKNPNLDYIKEITFKLREKYYEK